MREIATETNVVTTAIIATGTATKTEIATQIEIAIPTNTTSRTELWLKSSFSNKTGLHMRRIAANTALVFTGRPRLE